MPKLNTDGAVEAVPRWECPWCNSMIEGVLSEGCALASGTMICQECSDNETFCCYICDRRFANDDGTTVAENDYCQRCYEENCYYCETCETNRRQDDRCSCSDEIDMIEDCENDSIYNSDERENLPTREFRKVLPDDECTYGVELEAEGGTPSKMIPLLPKSAGIHTDGSLRDRGAEVVTPPLTMAGLEDYLPSVCLAMIAGKYQATRACGLHVHVKPSEKAWVRSYETARS